MVLSYLSNRGAQLKLMHVVSFFSGFHNKDVAFFHIASRTLIEADLIFNLPCIEQYSHTKSSGSLLSLSKYFNPHTYLHRQFVWSMGKDKRCLPCLPCLTISESHTILMSRDAQTVASWNFDRIIPCHGVCQQNMLFI